jgi:hypothetical protein
MVTSPSSVGCSSSNLTNHFANAPSVPIAAAFVNLINMQSHVPVKLDFDEANYA